MYLQLHQRVTQSQKAAALKVTQPNEPANPKQESSFKGFQATPPVIMQQWEVLIPLYNKKLPLCLKNAFLLHFKYLHLGSGESLP